MVGVYSVLLNPGLVSLYLLIGIYEYSLMMCLDAEDLKSWAGWDGATGLSRQHLLSELSSKWVPKIPSDVDYY